MPQKGERVKHRVDPLTIRENVDKLSNVSGEEGEMIYYFAVRLNDLMFEKDISQDELRKKLDVAAGTISSYRNGLKCPSMIILIKIANFLNVSVDWLLGLSECKEADDNKKIAMKTTGLSNNAVGNLMKLKKKINRGIEETKGGFFENILSDEQQQLRAINYLLEQGVDFGTEGQIADRRLFARIAYYLWGSYQRRTTGNDDGYPLNEIRLVDDATKNMTVFNGKDMTLLEIIKIEEILRGWREQEGKNNG